MLRTPSVPEGEVSVWAQYTVQAEDRAQRDKIMEGLKAQGIPTACYYPIPMHLSTAYASFGYQKGDLPVCEAAAERVFSLPMHPYLSEAEIDDICAKLKAVR